MGTNKTNWSVFVTGALAFANWVCPLPVPEEYRLPIGICAWMAFALACAGWCYAHLPYFKKWRAKPAYKHPVITVLIFVVCGALGVLVYSLSQRGSVKSTGEETKQPFVIDYRPGNCAFFTVEAHSSNKHLNNRKGIFVADITIVNNTGGSTTLKEVMLAYEHKGEKREVLGNVMPVGKLKGGEPALMLVWDSDQLMLVDWHDIRLTIAENKEKVSGAIWRGSSTFIFEPDIKSADDVQNPRLIARDYLGRASERHISPTNLVDWRIRDEAFTQRADGSIMWGAAQEPPVVTSPTATPAQSPAPKFNIKLIGGNIFPAEGEPKLTGLALAARIWNTGAPSRVVEWNLTITPKNGQPVRAQITKPPKQLFAKDPKVGVNLKEEDFALERLTSAELIKPNDAPIQSAILFYVAMPKSDVTAPDTVITLSASDPEGNEFSVTQRMGDWMQRDSSQP